MAVKMMTQNGLIEMSNDVIATVVGGAATDVFGIVGMASKSKLKIILMKFYEKRTTQKVWLSVKKKMAWQ